uniref:Uncharacterized protein n=1 Tax=Rhizophora mucronata TaxID=61149 RepID=A0A2P2J6J3_RHIMU
MGTRKFKEDDRSPSQQPSPWEVLTITDHKSPLRCSLPRLSNIICRCPRRPRDSLLNTDYPLATTQGSPTAFSRTALQCFHAQWIVLALSSSSEMSQKMTRKKG